MVREQRKKYKMGSRGFEGEGWGVSDELAKEGQFEEKNYTNWRSPRRKSKCYQKKQGRSRVSSRSESCQEF